jgi:hypothetical protein
MKEWIGWIISFAYDGIVPVVFWETIAVVLRMVVLSTAFVKFHHTFPIYLEAESSARLELAISRLYWSGVSKTPRKCFESNFS